MSLALPLRTSPAIASQCGDGPTTSRNGVEMFVCALVFVDADGRRSPNSLSGDPRSYVDQAVCLNRSLLRAGMPRLNIMTNAPDRIATRLETFPKETRPSVHRLATTISLPKDMPVYAAHFKLDLMDQVAAGLPRDAMMLLLDADMIAIRPLDAELLTRCAEAGLGAFDISDHVFPAYGFASVINDLEIIANRRFQNPRWYGGEFFLANQESLCRLVQRAREHYVRYVDAIGRLLHHGDEAFMSAALNTLADDGQAIVEVGAYQVVGRHWAGNTFRDLSWFRHCSFVHLPDGKALLARPSRLTGFVPRHLWRSVVIALRIGRARSALKWLRNVVLSSLQGKAGAKPRSAR